MSTIAPERLPSPAVQTEQGAPRTMIGDLIALQSDLPVVLKDSTNPHFKNKYASLHAIHRAVFPILAKHGFSWVTLPTVAEDGSTVLGYQLRHRSGDVAAQGAYPLPAGLDPQKLGSAITYARRYALCAVLGLVADEDDDAEGAAAPQRAAQASTAPSIREQVAQTFPGAKPVAKDECVECAAKGWKSKGKDGKEYPSKFWPDARSCNGRQPDGKYANHPRPVEDLPDANYNDEPIPF